MTYIGGNFCRGAHRGRWGKEKEKEEEEPMGYDILFLYLGIGDFFLSLFASTSLVFLSLKKIESVLTIKHEEETEENKKKV